MANSFGWDCKAFATATPTATSAFVRKSRGYKASNPWEQSQTFLSGSKDLEKDDEERNDVKTETSSDDNEYDSDEDGEYDDDTEGDDQTLQPEDDEETERLATEKASNFDGAVTKGTTVEELGEEVPVDHEQETSDGKPTQDESAIMSKELPTDRLQQGARIVSKIGGLENRLVRLERSEFEDHANILDLRRELAQYNHSTRDRTSSLPLAAQIAIDQKAHERSKVVLLQPAIVAAASSVPSASHEVIPDVEVTKRTMMEVNAHSAHMDETDTAFDRLLERLVEMKSCPELRDSKGEPLYSGVRRTNTRCLSKVPIYNFHLAFPHEGLRYSRAKIKVSWIVVFSAAVVDEELSSLCADLHGGCTHRGNIEEGGIPFIVVYATLLQLEKLLLHHRGALHVEPDIDVVGDPVREGGDVPPPASILEQVGEIVKSFTHISTCLPNMVRTLVRHGRTEVSLFDCYAKGLESGGRGVTIWAMGPGVNIRRAELASRAFPGLDSSRGPDDSIGCTGDDEFGDCAADTDGASAGTIGAIGAVGRKHLGIAKHAKLLAAKVLTGRLHGKVSSIISAMDYILRHHKKSRTREVVLYISALNSGVSPAFSFSIRQVIASGVVVVAAAGDRSADTCKHPIFADDAIVVGAAKTNGALESYSNFGDCVDIFAPASILVSGKVLSGTTVSAARVAGVAAVLLSALPLRNRTQGSILRKLGKMLLPLPPQSQLTASKEDVFQNALDFEKITAEEDYLQLVFLVLVMGVVLLHRRHSAFFAGETARVKGVIGLIQRLRLPTLEMSKFDRFFCWQTSGGRQEAKKSTPYSWPLAIPPTLPPADPF